MNTAAAERRRHAAPSSRRQPSLVALAVALFAAAGVSAAAAIVADRSPGPTGPATQAAVTDRAALLAASRPVMPQRLRIPALGVRTAMVVLSTDTKGRMQVPANPAVAGWYAAGPVPGDRGPAVVAGHRDSASGPAVFYRLAELRPGATVEVDRSDGRTARFRVVHVSPHRKAHFPTRPVYGPAPDRGLRLITCSGPYDRARGYPDNVVVYATLSAAR